MTPPNKNPPRDTLWGTDGIVFQQLARQVGACLALSERSSMALIFDFGEFPAGLKIRFGSLEFHTDDQGKLSFVELNSMEESPAPPTPPAEVTLPLGLCNSASRYQLATQRVLERSGLGQPLVGPNLPHLDSGVDSTLPWMTSLSEVGSFQPVTAKIVDRPRLGTMLVDLNDRWVGSIITYPPDLNSIVNYEGSDLEDSPRSELSANSPDPTREVFMASADAPAGPETEELVRQRLQAEENHRRLQ